MGGVGGKGKGARRRQKLLDNAKTFDKKSGTFREPKLELVNDKVSREDILRAPSSFRRFMEATRRAKAREERRDKQRRIAQGLEAPDDDDDDVDDDDPSSPRRDDTGAAEAKGRGGADDAPSSAGDGGEGGKDGKAARGRKGGRVGGSGGGDFEDEARGGSRPGRPSGSSTRADREEDEETGAEGVAGKRKYASLRERKREARKAAKLAKEEQDAFIGGVDSTARDASRGGAPSFGEVADAPPTITLKRKSGGKGAKHVPVAESGHKIAGGKGAGNRQAEIFASLMKNATRGGGKKNSGPGPVGGLRRAAEMDSLRERAIAEYRKMKGRPMNNGRSADLATDPSRLFTAVGGANVRRDAGR